MLIFGYLLRGVLLRWLVALPALVLVYLAFYLGDQGRILADRVGWGAAVRVALLHLPLIVVQVMPVALLLGSVLALAALRQRGELEALYALGAAPSRLWPPLLVAALLASTAALAVDEVVVPPCEAAADRVLPVRSASALTGLGPVPRWFRHGEWLVRLSGSRVLALEIGPGHRPRRRIEGAVVPGGVRRAMVTRLDGTEVSRQLRDRFSLPALDGLSSLGSGGGRAEALATPALARRLDALQRAGHARVGEALLLHAKLAFPALNLVVGLFACLFLVRRRSRAPVGDLAWAVALVIGLWLSLALGWALARVGWITAAAGAWGPVALAAVAALALLLARGRRG